MMDTAKSFLRGVMDVALVIIPLSVVLGIIFGPSVPFIGTAVVDNITVLSEFPWRKRSSWYYRARYFILAS